MNRALVLWCPDWPVTAVGVDAATAGAVVVQGQVAACTAAARAAGVRRGQRLRDAQRHAPELEVRDRDPDAEGRLFERVAAAIAEVTPWVEVVRPGMCALPARGAARYHGGEEALRILIQDTVVELGFDCGAGIADGLFAAELAARTGDGGSIVPPGGSAEFLAPYPVTVLGRPELAGLLDRLGIRTLGAFAALPVERVAERFGADGRVAHRLARGLEPRPVSPQPGRADLSVSTDFDPPADRADRVVFAAKSLADELHAGLAAAGLACVRLGIEVAWDDGREMARLWRHDGALSSLAVAERVRWQLAAWHPGEPDDSTGEEAGEGAGEGTGGIARLRLCPDQLVPDEGRQQALWGQTDLADRVARAAARIQAMLGHHAITQPVLVGGRGPGDQVVRVPLGDLPPRLSEQGPWPGRLPAPAPAVVHPEPVPAAVTDAAGALVMVSGRSTVSAPPAHLAVGGGPPVPVTAWTGPWPATEYWWDPERSRRRARFQLVTADAAYLVAVEGGEWHVEATYD
ncbi:DNA polymerase Y family protein [Actinomadura alba]|uniref:DNA polymerase Y family protein n=1 Tax=Actinomadura alba TaxID=406431 RepID=A0ABR7LZY9_9ACTN|nr:DNA polymerase Y family protein [Actinomadura alba]MBC6470346.1 DNA polymerase Y family protein [Actinomadura alba]